MFSAYIEARSGLRPAFFAAGSQSPGALGLYGITTLVLDLSRYRCMRRVSCSAGCVRLTLPESVDRASNILEAGSAQGIGMQLPDAQGRPSPGERAGDVGATGLRGDRPRGSMSLVAFILAVPAADDLPTSHPYSGGLVGTWRS